MPGKRVTAVVVFMSAIYPDKVSVEVEVEGPEGRRCVGAGTHPLSNSRLDDSDILNRLSGALFQWQFHNGRGHFRPFLGGPIGWVWERDFYTITGGGLQHEKGNTGQG